MCVRISNENETIRTAHSTVDFHQPSLGALNRSEQRRAIEVKYNSVGAMIYYSAY